MLCPDTIKFVMRSFKKAVYAKDIEKIADINLYPFGKGEMFWSEDEK